MLLQVRDRTRTLLLRGSQALTTKSADRLMLSHYAVNHTGICLEFGCANEVLSSSLQVVYCETYPPLDLADDDSQTILLPLITKAKAWEYEEEYRLIAQEEAEALNYESLITKNNLLLLPDGALTAIIVGCVAPEATREAVRATVGRSGRNLDLKHAVRVPTTDEISSRASKSCSAPGRKSE